MARALAAGLQSGGCDVETAHLKTVKMERLGNIDLLCVGTPVYVWNASKPANEFVERLKGQGALTGKRTFAFDTKVKSRFSGGAAEKVEKKLTELGFGIARPAESAIVKGKESPLEEGAEASFKQIGTELGRVI